MMSKSINFKKDTDDNVPIIIPRDIVVGVVVQVADR